MKTKPRKMPTGPHPKGRFCTPRGSWGRMRATTPRVIGHGPFTGQPCGLRTDSSLPLVIHGRVGRFTSALRWEWLDTTN